MTNKAKGHPYPGLRRARRILFVSCLWLCALLGFVLFRLPPLPATLLSWNASTSVYDAGGGLMYAVLSRDDEWCIPVSLDKMGRWTPAVAVAVEDRRFYRHGGVDFAAVARASFQNLLAGKVRSGASTITSQLLRIAHPRPRTVRAKLLEFWGAWQLETKMEKPEILELYLNRAPFGGNIRGVEAAARAYFNKPASALTLGESALLTGLLRAPGRLRPDRNPLGAKRLRDDLLAQLERGKVIPAEQCGRARLEPVRAVRYPMPRRAPLAARRAMRENLSGTRVDSTIDPAAQLLLERNLDGALAGLPEAISSAGIVVDNATRTVRAYVGNARLGADLPGSQVDCADAPRSPGSTLKPFVYAAAFARGLRTPATLLADTPIAFRGSAPRNYDLTYRGPVSTRLALALSLNAPAVRVLREVGYRGALDLYRRIGFSHIGREAEHYADSLVLGGCEVSVSELAAAYAALAGGGEYGRLRFSRGPAARRSRVLSPGAAFLTLDILRDERRLLPLYQQIFGPEGRTVAFKTGTSYGTRDAWTAACSKRYTVVVWFGDPAGRSHPQLVGLELAAPAALKVLGELRSDGDDALDPPGGVYRRTVCALSGELPANACPYTTDDYAVADVSPQSLCTMHLIREGRLVTLWPAELSRWSQMRGRVSASEAPARALRITRPRRGSQHVLQKGGGALRLFVSAEGGGEQYWYLNGRFAAKNPGAEGIFIDVPAGVHRLSVLTGEESDVVEFEVLPPEPRRQREGRSPVLLDE